MNRDAYKVLLLVFLTIFVVGLIIFGPLALIGSLNTLFNLHIPYTLFTWLSSAFILYAFGSFNRNTSVKKND